MEGKKQLAVVMRKYGGQVEVKEDYPIPVLNEGELLIKVQATTVNPVDREILHGRVVKKSLPAVCGLEGTGTIIDAKGESAQSWIGKRVCFINLTGSWCEYAVSLPLVTFQISQDVPLSSACCGIVNPLTAIGFLDVFKHSGCKGIIQTAAASSLGKMVTRMCLKDHIPLLNLVRRKEQAEQLKKQGDTKVIVTEGDWQKEFRAYIQKKNDNNVFFDALGGGPITEYIINNMGKGLYYVTSNLQEKPFHITDSQIFHQVPVSAFSLFDWWGLTIEQTRHKIRTRYSSLLKSDCKSSVFAEVELKNIKEAIELSKTRSNQGKVLVRIP